MSSPTMNGLAGFRECFLFFRFSFSDTNFLPTGRSKTKSPGWDSGSSSAIPTPNLVVRGDPIAFGTALPSASLSSPTAVVESNGKTEINGATEGNDMTTANASIPNGTYGSASKDNENNANGNGVGLGGGEVGSDAQGALWVNPWDLSAVATAMHRALLMPEAEKVVRHRWVFRFSLLPLHELKFDLFILDTSTTS